MKQKDEIKFWQRAIKLLESGYGKNLKPHKGGISIDCVECRTGFAVSVLENHIGLLKWWNKIEKKSKK